MQTASSDKRYKPFNWEKAYALWGMHRLKTYARWIDSTDSEHGEDRKWRKMN